VPTTRIDDINLYYEIHGEGEPVVLITGLASDLSELQGIIRALSAKYQVLAFDNRGAGRTDKPDIPYSIELMARDTAGLMRAVGITRAHVIGISMGGRIALELALRHPQMVNKLVLVSTSARMVPTRWRHILFDTLPRIPIFKGQYPQPYYAFVRQREATSAYNCTDRLPDLRSPTLIMHGMKDRVTPISFAQEMHALIPGAEMLTFGGGHLFPFFRQQEFIDALVTFLDGHTPLAGD
jgi:3-oxoadipate enol-lactonase